MQNVPPDAKRIFEFEKAGPDEAGKNICFGFRFEDKSRCVLWGTHEQLGETLQYLNGLAHLAQQMRMKADPRAKDLEIRELNYGNLVQQIAPEIDLTGDSTALMCTTKVGTQVAVQIPLPLLEQLHQRMPQLIAEMKRRKTSSQNRQ